MALLAIDTTTPFEERAYPYLTEYLRDVGFHVRPERIPTDIVRHQDYSPHPSSVVAGRWNLRAVMPARRTNPRTLFNCHIDVVPRTAGGPAVTPVLHRDCVTGRGSCDTKNNLIMLAEAVRFVCEHGGSFTRDVEIDIVVEEELGGNGTLGTVLNGRQPDEVVVMEPTGLNVFCGHRGCLSFEAEILGRPVHMGGSASGVSAIDGAFWAIKRIKKLERQMIREAVGHPDFLPDPPPVKGNVGLIMGGEWTGSVPERCVIQGNFGFVSPETVESVLARIVNALQAGDDGVRCTVKLGGLRSESYMSPRGEAVFQDLHDAIRNAGIPQKVIRAWDVSCDGRLHSRLLGVPTAIFGSGCLSEAHSHHESLQMKDLWLGMWVLVQFLTTCRVDRAPRATGETISDKTDSWSADVD